MCKKRLILILDFKVKLGCGIIITTFIVHLCSVILPITLDCENTLLIPSHFLNFQCFLENRSELCSCNKYKECMNQITQRKLTDFCSCFDSDILSYIYMCGAFYEVQDLNLVVCSHTFTTSLKHIAKHTFLQELFHSNRKYLPLTTLKKMSKKTQNARSRISKE